MIPGAIHAPYPDLRDNIMPGGMLHRLAAADEVCVCDFVALLELAQPTVSHHLKVLREAGIVGSERQGLWAYYYVNPDALKELSAWLS